MQRALRLAEQGRGAVEPNPMVGAVIVREGRILAEGYHRRFGGPHAEIEALAAARAAGQDVAGATMYVTLEPCRHAGKTPPCTDALIAAKLRRVVAAMLDPDENVAGRGVEQLRRAGIEVSLGLCQAQAEELLCAYVTLRTQGRPWVIAKWAQSADGYLALPAGRGRWISGEASRRRVHELRSRCDGILVGIGTVLADDPQLTNRSGHGKQPARVVLDSRLTLPLDCQLVRTARESPVLLATTAEGVRTNPRAAERLKEAGVDVLVVASAAGRVDLVALLSELGRREWTYLLVEGGEAVLRSFLAALLVDELQVYVSKRIVGEAALPNLPIEEALRTGVFVETAREPIGEDTWLRCRRRGIVG